MRRQLSADQPQNSAAMLVAPIVDDVLHHVGVATLRHALEEASSLHAQAAAAGGETIGRHASDHLGEIEQHALHSRVFLQDRGEQQPMPSAKIGEALDAGEIVRREDRLRGNGRSAAHRPLEGLGLLGAFGEQIEDRLAVGHGDAVAAGADAVGHVDVGAHRPFIAEHHRRVAHGSRHVGLEQCAERGQRELGARLLGEHADARQHAHHAVERRGMSADFRRKLVGGDRRVAHVIGDAKPRQCRQRRRELLAEQKLRHDPLWRDGGLRRRIGHAALLAKS